MFLEEIRLIIQVEDTEGGNVGIKIVGDSMMGLDKLLRDVSQDITLEIGIAADADPKTIMKAVINEYGYDSPGIYVTPAMRRWFAAQGYPLKKSTAHIKIPARPFISAGIYDNLEEIWGKMDSFVDLIHLGKMTPREALDTLGGFIVMKIQEYMLRNKTKENHPLTIDRKGHAKPLIGTGDLRNSVTYGIKGGTK